MTSPLVSVITPVLNRVETIDLCIGSVMNQRYPNVEHIIVDGGSTDGTLEAIERAASCSALRWVSGRDGGMYEAINKGLEMAGGSVLAYLNSDDLYLPWTIDSAVRALGARDADLVYGDLAVLIRRQDRRAFYLQFYPDFDRRLYTFERTMAQPTVFWTADLARRLGSFDTTYRLLGDCDYWLRAADAGCNMVHIAEVLAVQVEHEATLRELHVETLRDEFARLRTAHGSAAGAPRRSIVAGAGRRIGWRTRQLRLLRESRSTQPQHWSEFVGLLTQAGLRVDVSYLFWHLFPVWLRSSRLSLVRMPDIEEAILGTARTQALSDRTST